MRPNLDYSLNIIHLSFTLYISTTDTHLVRKYIIPGVGADDRDVIEATGVGDRRCGH